MDNPVPRGYNRRSDVFVLGRVINAFRKYVPIDMELVYVAAACNVKEWLHRPKASEVANVIQEIIDDR